MAATYDADTPVGTVRLLISDTDLSDPLFEDNEIQRFLALRGDDELLAAALALRTIAGNEAQVLKVIRLLDLDTDGAAVSKELRQLAQTLEDSADDAASEAGFDIAPIVTSTASWRERLRNEALRG